MKNSKETRIVIQHANRSKAGMNEDFTVKNYEEIRLGRSTSCDIAFDPDADNMVSRHHATIKALNDGTFRYQLIDENSTNGVIVNGQKIKGMAVLVPGDRVQLGKKGPEFTFDLSPRPDALLSKTRIMAAAAPKTEVRATQVATKVAPATATSLLNRRPVQLMTTVAAGIFLAILLVSASGWIEGDTAGPITPEPTMFDSTSTSKVISKAPATMSASQVASEYRDAVVYISNSWKLEDAQGKQMYHRYTMVELEGKQYIYPCYVRNGQGQLEPFIEAFNYQGYSKPIGAQASGTGFVVSEDGFIMTNKHVSAPWNSPYLFDRNAFPGLEVNGYGQLMITADTNYVTVSQDRVSSWIPAEAYVGSLPDHKMFEGKMVYQDVIFANRTGRHPARVTRVSDKHDVAMLKVDVGSKLKTVDLLDNYKDVQSGQEISILGYPALTPNGEKYETGNGPSTSSKVRIVPNLSINQGIISALHKGSKNFDRNSLTRSQYGDAYQLSINSAGSGNSGGPMFNKQGKVIGIYFASMTDYVTTTTFAIPIKYGIELLSL